MSQPTNNQPEPQVDGQGAVTEDLIGSKIGNYRLVGWLGRGAAADVYHGIEEPLERPVALKLMIKDADNKSDPNFAARFLQEARAIAILHHPNIITVYQYGEWQKRPFIVTELMEGGSLSDLLRQQNALSLSETLSIISQVGAGLSQAHANGIVHRDIKPSNVLLDNNGRAVIADFGIAKVLNSNINYTIAGMSIGTPEYMSPEQATGQTVDQRSDIYSLGILTYRLLTGHCPFENESALAILISQTRETPPPLRHFNPNIPPQVEIVVLRALAKRPEERYQTVIEFVNALEAAAGQNFRLHDRTATNSNIFVAEDPNATLVNPAHAQPAEYYHEENPEIGAFEEPTAVNPRANRRNNYSHRAQPQPDYENVDYNVRYRQTPEVPRRPADSGYYTPGSGYIPVETAQPAQPPRRRGGRILLFFILGALVAAAVFLALWFSVIHNKTNTNLANTPASGSTAANTATSGSIIYFASPSATDGKWIIYSATDSGTVQKIVDINTDAINPVLSPDGKSLLYVHAPGDTNWAIHKVNTDGSNDVALTNGQYQDQYPSWSPDGKSIAFNRTINKVSQLYIMDANGQNQRKLSNDTVSYLSWSPSKLIIYATGSPNAQKLRTIDPTNGQTKDLTALAASNYDYPVWSPDGKQIAFVKGIATSSTDNRAVFVANSDGSNAHQISPSGEIATNPVWSPDGKSIAYLHKTGIVNNRDKWEIIVGNSDGSNTHVLDNDGQQKFYLDWGLTK